MEGVDAFERLVDMLDRFAPSNQALIDDHDRKVKLGRKTSREVPDQMFRDATSLMV